MNFLILNDLLSMKNANIFIETIKLTCLIISVIFPLQLFSVPAIKRPVTVKQNDGSVITLTLMGDEYSHYYSTLDSIPVFKKDDSYYYGALNNDELIISDILAHEKEIRSDDEIGFLSGQIDVVNYICRIGNTIRDIENGYRTLRMSPKKMLGDDCSYIGSKRGLVILIEFTDLKFAFDSANNDFSKMFNQPGYSQNGSIGSVRDYFLDQSYGQFSLSFDVVGPVSLSNNMSYYGSNTIETGSDRRPYEMVIEACKSIDEDVDFTRYDWDNDGEVDQVFLVYAGYGEHAGAPSNTIWPHESRLNSKKIQLDGVYINTYACSCELRGTSGDVLNGIGTSCHEFSHCLGLPDFYDTDYSGAFGMSYWDVMNSGSHSGPEGWGEVPYGYSAYERWYAGWLNPIEVDNTQENLKLRDIGMYPESYIIYNEGNRNEYYLLENHQPERWFQYVGTNVDMHGLMVTHIDYDKNAWKNNVVNPNSQHQRMSIIPADNKYGTSEEDLRGDLYPGFTNTTFLSYTSHQDTGGKLFNQNVDGSYNMYLSIGSIKEDGGVVNFNIVNTFGFPVPEVKAATEISMDGYTANWVDILESDSYIIEQTSSYLLNSVFPVTKSQTLEISDQSSCKLNWLLDNCDAKYRIKGIIKGIPTEWSEFIIVEYPLSVEMTTSNDSKDEVNYFGLDGVSLASPINGINIVKKGTKVHKTIMSK